MLTDVRDQKTLSIGRVQWHTTTILDLGGSILSLSLGYLMRSCHQNIKLKYIYMLKAGVVVHACNSRTQKAEAERSSSVEAA